ARRHEVLRRRGRALPGADRRRGVVAHYGVEGDGFYGIPLSRWLPYSLLRTWHVQLRLFCIPTPWLATRLFIGPLVLGVAAAGRERALRRSGPGRRWLAGRPVLEHPWATFRRRRLLLGPSGLGVSGSRAGVAGRSVPRPADLARSHATGHPARPRRARRTAASRFHVRPLRWGHRPVLWRRAHVRPAYTHQHGGILALVGGSPLGRGLLRGLRHHGYRVSFRPVRSPFCWARGPGFLARRRSLSRRRYHRYQSLFVFLGHVHGSPRLGRDTERPRGGAPSVDRLPGDEGPKNLSPDRMGTQISLAHLFLHRRRLLEPGGGGALRLHDQ